jgi:hypothetical protein
VTGAVLGAATAAVTMATTRTETLERAARRFECIDASRLGMEKKWQLAFGSFVVAAGTARRGEYGRTRRDVQRAP